MKFINIVYANLKCLIKNEIKYNRTSIDDTVDNTIKNRYITRSRYGWSS